MDTIKVSVGICAYNEENIIGRCIDSIYAQSCNVAEVVDVIVVSSGSTDRTNEIVRSLCQEHSNLSLIVQEKREGKNSAINCYLDAMKTDIAVMLNGDNVFGTPDSLDNLVQPFYNGKVGITGGRPVPVNDYHDKVGYAVNMMWLMHHSIALMYPKIGELIAFRDIGTRLRSDMQSDEDTIRMKLEDAGYKCLYIPDSIVRNRGPETEEDFIKQRVRVNVGEITMKRTYDYDIPTWNKWFLFKSMVKNFFSLGFHPFKMLYTVRLEFRCRRIAKRHVRNNGDSMSVWDRVDSTKKL